MLSPESEFAPELTPTRFAETSVGRGEGAQSFFELTVSVFKQNNDVWLAHIETLEALGTGADPGEALRNAWQRYERTLYQR